MSQCRFPPAWILVPLFFSSSVPVSGGEEPVPAVEEVDADLLFFRSSIEPILSRRCYSCHSHAAGEFNGGLALDWKSGWQTGGDRGPAVIPGNPDDSLLIRAIRHRDPELKMPEERLPESEIAALEEWVQRGAADPRTVQPEFTTSEEAADWWSLRPPGPTPIPAATPQIAGDSESGWAQNPIDRFLAARMAEHAITPSPVADRRILARRLYMDLHGLHPSPEDVAEFVEDPSPHAWENLTDRLLASPRYGERWARHWMDTIHYADTHGFEHDVLRTNAWKYRDYVIESFNRDQTWDRFIREQLAADVFYPDETTLTPALGFLGAGTYDHSAAATAIRMFENLDRDDLVTQTMSAFTSTTVNCARCHAHKFDPISQEDYYSLQAVFSGIGKGDILYDSDPETAVQRKQWMALKLAAEQKDAAVLLSEHSRSLVSRWEHERGSGSIWRPLHIETFTSLNGATLVLNPDSSISSTETRPEKETTTVTGTTSLTSVSAIRLDALSDASLPMSGPGRMDNGNFHLSELHVEVHEPDSLQPRRLKFSRATADFDQSGWTGSHAIDDNEATAWGIFPRVGEHHFAVFELAEPLTVIEGTRLVVILRQLHGGGHILGRFTVSVTDGDATQFVAVPLETDRLLGIPADLRSHQEQLEIAAWALRHLADQALAALPEPAKVYAAGTRAENERGVITFAEPRTIHVLRRGDPEKPGAVAEPGALSVVTWLPARFSLPEGHHESQRRAALADWIAHPENPLTWRSIVNRVWHYHFGRGLCDTPGDFGRMGGDPSHPELLDWLAVWFRDEAKGSLKELHRLIVTTAAYRQESTHRASASSIDTDNRLLWRMNAFRMDADCIRDAVMNVSGTLDLTMGGPGVACFLSGPGPQLTPVLDYDAYDWNTPGSGRRSIYRIVWRGIQDPLMESLDFPDMGQLTPVRSVSSSPLQSLTLWNNRFMLHHAERFAERLASEADDIDGQIRRAVRLCWLRDPDDEELRELRAAAETGGLASVCRVLLNSNEFLFVE